MKTKPIQIILILCCTIFSCKKNSSENSNAQLSDAFYKAKLEKMVNLTLISDTAGKNLKPMKFHSFKEMYDAFKFVETGQVFTKMDSAKAQKSAISARLTTNSSPSSTTSHFIFSPSDITNINGSIAGQLSDLYSVSFSVGFTLNSSTNTYEVQGLSATATNYSVTYGGLAAITNKSIIYSSGTYGGGIKSNLQGSGVIDGDTYSILVAGTANYTCTAPSNPAGTGYCYHTFSANSSTEGSGNPPQ